MKRCAVFVATTDGPVRIERITAEAAPQSMVCLGRSSEVLSISGDYDDFVRPGSGVILRECSNEGEQAYRLDMSGPISGGRSWQLAVFAAHVLHRSEHMALAPERDADLILWLTGTVDYDLHVGVVDHLPTKIAAARPHFEAWAVAGIPVLAACAGDAEAAMLRQAELPGQVEILGLQTVQDLLDRLPLGPTELRPLFTPVPVPTPKRRFPWLFLAASAAVAGALAFLWPRPAVEPLPDVPLLHLSSPRGATPVYHFGERLDLRLVLANDAWVYCFYHQADGTTLQLLPNSHFPKARLFGGRSYDLPGADLFPFDLQVAPPAGEEQVICYAADRDITAELSPALQEGHFEALPDSLTQSKISTARLRLTVAP
ncbi:hypothetical protein JCM17960_16090 [Magnetospira thiophila]